jgi:WD40 repeat protein
MRQLLTLVVLCAGLVANAGAQPPAKPAPTFPPINPAQARPDHTLGGLAGPGFAIAGNDDAGILAAACEHDAIQYWHKDVMMGVRGGDGTPHVLKGHGGPILALALGGGKVLASAGADRKVLLWEMPDGKLLHTLSAAAMVRSLAESPDGKTLAGGGEDGTVQFWDIATGQPKTKLAGHTDWILALAFSGDGKLLASGGYDGVVRLWEVGTGKKLLDIPAKPAPPPNPPANPPPSPPNAVLALAFSPDGKQLAVGGSDAMIHIFNTADGKIVRSIAGHTSSVTALAYHPTGTLLVSGSKDRTIRLWNPANGQSYKSLEGHTSWVQGVVFLAQGTRLASVGADQTVRLWDLTEPAKK